MLGVASIDEAFNLKETGLPIVILSPTSTTNISVILDENFVPTVTHHKFARELSHEARRKNKKAKVHIEVDTGMIRTGVPWEESVNFISQIGELSNIEIEGIFTHFSEPESKDSEFTYLQIKRFNRILTELKEKGIHIPLIHAASTAAILNYPETHFNMVRPGIILYGMYSSPTCERKIKLEPILSLYTRVCQINYVPKGTGISYGRKYKTKKKEKIATLWVGYGDGYPRSLSNKGKVIIKGKVARVVGAICMDLTTINVTNIPHVKVGDRVTLIGEDGGVAITADEVASLADTINYELTTRICPRVPKLYIKDGKPYKVNSLCGTKSI
jgi:alanine racemase